MNNPKYIGIESSICIIEKVVSVIKGCQKKMFVLKDTGSVYFDEAYFVLKPNPPSKAMLSEKDFLDEANRIITEYSSGKSPLLGKSGKKSRHRLI